MSKSGGLDHFPPVGDPDRYGAIISRGRRLRRRRLLVQGTGATGAALACVALLFAFTGSDRAADQSLHANDGGTKDSQNQQTVSKPEKFTITIKESKGDLTVTLDDPRAAVPSDPGSLSATAYSSRQCATAIIEDSEGATVAEGYGCTDLGTAKGDIDTIRSDGIPLELSPIGSVAIGCAATEERSPLPDLRNLHATSSFDIKVPESLEPGEHRLRVTAVSGFGDGCASGTDMSSSPDGSIPETGYSQVENQAAADSRFTVRP